MTPSQTNAELARLERKAKAAKAAQATADRALKARDEKATDLADKGVPHRDLAAALGISVDGVTYVLRKVRAARST